MNIISGLSNCTDSSWSSHTEPVTLTIVSGSQYASLHRMDPQTGVDTKIGSIATTIGDSVGDYSLVADGIEPASPAWVKVEARSNGMTEIDSTQVLPSAVKLVILQPTTSSPNDAITSAPEMPTVVCKAQLQNFSGGQVTYNWMFSTADTFAQETAKEPRHELAPRYSGVGFSGQTTAPGSAVSQWTVPIDTVFTGGRTLLIVTATTGEGKTYSDTVHANVILGENPSIGVLEGLGLSPAEKTIMTMETSTWHQFNETASLPYNRIGYPIYGAPHGFGLMQLDNSPSPSEQDLWSWRANLNDGLSKFNSMLKSAGHYAARVEGGKSRYVNSEGKWVVNDPVSIYWYGHYVGKKYVEVPYSNAGTLTSDQVLREAFQRYNGGAYWRWYPYKSDNPTSAGQWRADPPKGTGSNPTPYGDTAWNVYEKILGGWTPTN